MSIKCHECGSPMKKVVKVHQYTECGLTNVYLHDMPVYRCRNGHEEVVIPSMAGLHELIARELLRKEKALAGPEIRFLRKQMGLKSLELAEKMGVTPVTVSRWENDSSPIGPEADRLLRLMFLSLHKPALRKSVRPVAPQEILDRTPVPEPWKINIQADDLRRAA